MIIACCFAIKRFSFEIFRVYFFLLLRYGGWSFDADGTKFRSTVWFNNKGHHALPSFTNGLSNVMLRAMVPSGEAEQYGM